MRNKRGFLLLEVIIVLFILSLVVIPWISFIGAIQKNQNNAQLNDYFLTKEVFINAYNGDMSLGEYVTHNKQFMIGKEGEFFYVSLLEGTIVKEEIRGKAR